MALFSGPGASPSSGADAAPGQGTIGASEPLSGAPNVVLTPHRPRRTTSRWGYLWDLATELIIRDLKLRYKRSFLGIAWSLATPLAQFLVLRFVFTVIVPLDVPNFTSFLFAGILVWGWLSASLSQCAGSIVDNRSLVRQAGFPVAILPVVTVAANLIHFVMALPVLALFVVLSGEVSLSPAPLLLPLLIAVQFMSILSLGYFVASLQVTFRDVEHLLAVCLTLWYYLTPVFYEVRDVPAQYALLYTANPMVHLLAAYRAILLDARLPDLEALAAVAAASAVFLWIGYRTFRRASAQFVDEI